MVSLKLARKLKYKDRMNVSGGILLAELFGHARRSLGNFMQRRVDLKIMMVLLWRCTAG